MPEKKLLIVSSHMDEAITKWVLENDSVEPVIEIIFIKELLNNFDIRDELDKNGPIIQWQDTRGNKYSNNTHYLLNRVINVDEHLFEAFREEDRDYAQREFEAYLGFALNAFTSPQNQAINGVCERFKTLPQQWQMSKLINGVSIPKYYWGSPKHQFLSDEDGVVHSNVFDCLNWSSNQIYNQKETGFCFIKPKGEPLFVLSMGEKDLITSGNPLSRGQQERIKGITEKFRGVFRYFIFELLLFVNGEQITFGCINIDVIQSAKNPGFDHFMRAHLREESSKCLN